MSIQSSNIDKCIMIVPLDNFEQDWVIHTADIFFARALRDQQQILWVSDNGIPDLGGDNEEETCYSNEIHNLAVNALLKSNQVNEMEGGTLFGYDHDLASGSHLPNEQLGLDEATSCSPAFRAQTIDSKMPCRCSFIRKYICRCNVATSVQMALHPRSKLHDPALHRMLHKVMKKVFALLIAEFRKLGATAVFANFSKIILDTGKSDLFAAQAYCDSFT